MCSPELGGAKFIFRLPSLPPCVSVAQEECWTYGCSPSGNSHGTLIICEWKELWSSKVWMNVCIWGVLALSFAPFFHFSLSFHCHFPWSDIVWPEWAKMRAAWNCPGKWLPWKMIFITCIRPMINTMHKFKQYGHEHEQTWTITLRISNMCTAKYFSSPSVLQKINK